MEVGEDGSKVSRGASEHQSSLSLSDVDEIRGDDTVLLVQRGRVPRQLNGHVIDGKAVNVLWWGTGSCNSVNKTIRLLNMINYSVFIDPFKFGIWRVGAYPG